MEIKINNINLTRRDLSIFLLLSKLKVINSSTLSWLISKNTIPHTFVKRLKKLKDFWYITNINKDKEIIWEQVFSLVYIKQNLDKIENLLWEKIYKNPIPITNSLYYHEYFLSKLVLHIKNKLEDKLKKEINIDELISSYKINDFLLNERKNINTKYKNLNYYQIPDSLIILWNNSFIFELENMNKNIYFYNKLLWYKKLSLICNKNNPFFKERLIIYVWVRECKYNNYLELIKKSWIEKIENIKIFLIKLEEL